MFVYVLVNLSNFHWQFLKVKSYTPDQIQGQSKGQKVNRINNTPISNMMPVLESLYNFLSEYMF